MMSAFKAPPRPDWFGPGSPVYPEGPGTCLAADCVSCYRPGFSCKASVRRRNASGQTAYDVAVNSGCNSMVSLLAAQTGLDLLGKLGKVNPDVF